MKKSIFWLLFIFILILIVGCAKNPTGEVAKKYSFQDSLNEIKEIEKKFNFTADYPESLDDKWSMFGQLNNIKNYIENLKKDEEINVSYHYILFRTKELESKIKFQMATGYKLRVSEDNTLICPKKEVYKKRMEYFNESVKLGNEAVENLNVLINKYPKYFDKTKLSKILPKLLEAQYYKIEEGRAEEEKTVNELCFNGKV